MSGNVEYYPLTHPQKGIWYTEKLYPGTSIGNITATLKISADVDFNIMEKAINLVIKKNDAFRMRIVEINGEPMQYVTEYKYRKIDFFDFSSHNIERLYEWDERQTQTPFELINCDLCYFAVLKIANGFSGFFIKVHHTIGDAWTVVLLTNEVMDFYHKLINAEDINDECFPSYIEYIKSEEKYKNTERYFKDKQFWNDKFFDIPDVTSLKSRKNSNISTESKRRTFVIPGKLCSKIHSYCNENKISILTLFSSALSIYASRVLDKNDITLGTPVLNRVNHTEKETVGMFINMVPIRLKTDTNLDFKAYVEYVQKEWMSVLKHQRYSVELLNKDLKEKSKSFEKLYDITLSYQNSKLIKKDESLKQEGRWHFNGHQTEALNIHINERENDGNLVLDYDYLPGLFYSKEIEYIHDHVIRILWHALDNPGKTVSRLDMVSEKEKSKILMDFNNTDAEFPKDKSIDQVFEEQVKKTPDNIAVVFKDKSITYRQLDEKAAKLAHYLRHKGVCPETIVGIMVSKSIDVIVGILGIVKAGGCYLPIDPDYPSGRINYMLEDSKTQILLINEPVNGDIAFSGLLINLKDEEVYSGPVFDKPRISNPEDLLYIIYTSGSTGNPKGTMITHKNVLRLLFNSRFSFDFNESDSWSLFHSICFDFSVWEMYGALLYGGKLVIISKEDSRDTKSFLKILEESNITVLNQTPSAFNNLIMEESQNEHKNLKLRYVIFGGEALKPNILQPFKARYPEVKLINMYGITETTVHVTYKEIGDNEILKNSCNIGRPIPTTKVYILDKNLNLLPIGIPGEICVSGDGVGRGYLNRDELTKSRFVKNPYNDEILYRSGDLGRFYADGEIEYLGRIDNQVKIRGFRIELGEIASALLKHHCISDAVVTTKANKQGDNQLVAFYVADKDIENIRKYLAKTLPEYMIPSYFIRISKIPLTINGKADLKSLYNLIDNCVMQNMSSNPVTETQKKLAEIWGEVLGVENIGIDDNFFNLGGDSLSAVKVNIKIGNAVTFTDLYNNPTIRQLSELLEETASTSNMLLTKLTKNNAQTEYSIISFPYGGGDAGSLLALSKSLGEISPDYTLYAFNTPRHYPGEAGKIVDDLVEEIKNTIHSKKIILYGHCVGSALALKVADALQGENIHVNSVCIGGILPPRLQRILGKSFDPWRFVSNKMIIRFLRKLGLAELCSEAEALDSIIENYRYDVRNYYKYFYELSSSKTKLESPIYHIVGEADPMTWKYGVKYKNWLKYSNEVKLFVIDKAGHYFIKTNSNELADILVSIN